LVVLGALHTAGAHLLPLRPQKPSRIQLPPMVSIQSVSSAYAIGMPNQMGKVWTDDGVVEVDV
jgi:hypothetical protein